MPELTLSHPERWWLFLALPLLYCLLRPPRPRRVHWTAHLSQWRLALAGLRRRPPRALSLRTLLLLVAAGCAALAALGPTVRGRPGPDRLVVALDASASMAARGDDGRPLCAEARERLASTFAGLPPHVEVTVLSCGARLVRRHGVSARALQDLPPPGGSLPVDLAALADRVASDETVFWAVTDGQGQRMLPAKGALTVLGAPAPNAAIVEVRVRDHWPLPELALEVDLVAFGAGEVAVELAVGGAVVEPARRSLTLASGVGRTVPLSLRRTAAGGELHVSVSLAGDRLPDDDRWTATLPALPAPRIAVLAEEGGGPFARVAAEALAREVGGEVVEATPGVEVGLLLVDGGEIPIVPGAARMLCFGSSYPGGEDWPARFRPGPIEWDRDLPLTAGLDLAELRVERVSGSVLPPGEAFLFAVPDGRRRPLGVVTRGDERASIHFGFRLGDGNLPLLAAFPQLLRRSFVRCYGRSARITVGTEPSEAGELDLRARASGDDRPLPRFGTPDRGLGDWLMLGGLALLALRAFLR